MKVLIHTCCAPCSTEVIERLKHEEIVLFFSDSNIYPKSEYDKRLSYTKKISKKFDVKLLIDNYAHEEWKDFIKGFEEEKEGGARCLKCFEFNLVRTAIKAKELGISNITTTLTISPYKNSKNIFEIGKKLKAEYGIDFLEFDFKKKDGYKKSIEHSKKHNLYRQNYCGCEFSLNNSIASPSE